MICVDIIFVNHRGLMSGGSSPLTTAATLLSPTDRGLRVRIEIRRVPGPLITAARLQQGDLPFAFGLVLSLFNGSRRVKNIGLTHSAALVALAVSLFLVALRAGILCATSPIAAYLARETTTRIPCGN
jgi:hypothetical protein